MSVQILCQKCHQAVSSKISVDETHGKELKDIVSLLGDEIIDDSMNILDHDSSYYEASLSSSPQLYFQSLEDEFKKSDLSLSSLTNSLSQVDLEKERDRIPSNELNHFRPKKNKFHKTSLRHRLLVAQYLLENISSQKESLEYPLCNECASFLFDKLESQTEQLLAENNNIQDAYTALLKLSKESPEDLSQLDMKLEKSKKELEELHSNLNELETEKKNLKLLIDQIEKELAEVLQDQERAAVHNSQLRLDYEKSLEEIHFYKNYQDYLNKELDILKKSNVLNDLFHISHDTVMGTINQFRLGRLPSVKVEWIEINTALGHCLLLSYLLAKKIQLTFSTYKLVPMGNVSRIEKISGDRTSYELYFPSDYMPPTGGIGKVFQASPKFNLSIVPFLDCIHQLGDSLSKKNEKFMLPFKIEKGLIGGVSALYQSQSSENDWTDAMRYLLIDLKWCLAFSLTLK